MIPIKIKDDVIKKVKLFNLESDYISYIARYQDDFLFLDRCYRDRITLFARLTYTGSFNNWECAVFNYSSNSYEELPVNIYQGALVNMMQYGLQEIE